MFWHVNVYFTDQNMQRGDPRELNFDGLEMKKSNLPIDRAQTLDEKMV